MKQAVIQKAADTPATGEQLAKINRFSRRELSVEEVYVFSLLLCDNEVDRDYERFPAASLEKLAALFVGKTGIFDHNPRGENQTARIFETAVETDQGRLTAAGEPYAALRAWAYMVRCDKNADLILEIDAGIKKEVSVGCAIATKACSICGANRHTEPCAHLPGRFYDGKLCHTLLSGAKDAYEWSFVAIPAQPKAGVTKAYSTWEGGNPSMKDWHSILKNTGNGITLTQEQAGDLLSHIHALEALAQEGKQYRNALSQEVIRLCALHLPQLDLSQCPELLQKCSTQELAALKAMLSEAQANPPAAQLTAPEAEQHRQEHQAFLI